CQRDGAGLSRRRSVPLLRRGSVAEGDLALVVAAIGRDRRLRGAVDLDRALCGAAREQRRRRDASPAGGEREAQQCESVPEHVPKNAAGGAAIPARTPSAI